MWRRLMVCKAALVSCPINNVAFVAIKMGRRQGREEGAYLDRYVTDEQRSRRPIFIATLRAVGQLAVFFRLLTCGIFRVLLVYALYPQLNYLTGSTKRRNL